MGTDLGRQEHVVGVAVRISHCFSFTVKQEARSSAESEAGEEAWAV